MDDWDDAEYEYTEPNWYINKETDTIWQELGGEYVDSRQTPTVTERWAFAMRRTDTPFLSAIQRHPQTLKSEWGVSNE